MVYADISRKNDEKLQAESIQFFPRTCFLSIKYDSKQPGICVDRNALLL
jgi:hypothetical protein